jgi:DNA (cytosine-5)-methyltransferase 1
MTKKVLRVAELFAGVGGFRIALEGWNGKSAISKYKKPIPNKYKIVWSNQFEPSTPKSQIASWIYENRFKEGFHSNIKIEDVKTEEIEKFGIDLLVGGFPCQDYSVASLLKNSKWLIGKKGVLWWQIHRILYELKRKPDYLILENVDRLLKSPSKQRGRDFAIMLASLNDLGYAIEWRIINASEIGFPQKRKRIFIIGYRKGTSVFNNIIRKNNSLNIDDIILNEAFPVELNNKETYTQKIEGTLDYISNNFNLPNSKSKFLNSGICWNREFKTLNQKTIISKKQTPLKNILQNEKDVPQDFYVQKGIVFDTKKGWAYHKGAKKVNRVDKETGHEYTWSEGKMELTENLDLPIRTIITSEGGKSPSRSRHLIKIESSKGNVLYRRLTPIELERANMFPDDFTKNYKKENSKLEIVNYNKRAFLMGNALVIGVVEKIGSALFDKTIK